MRLEQDLRHALKRKDPPTGFDDRVLSRIASGETAHVRTSVRRQRQVLLPVAASLMLAFGTTYYLQQQQQRRALEAQTHAQQTAEDVVLALQIASETISAAQARVEEITRYEPTKDY
jgi:uncharacterized protein HemX